MKKLFATLLIVIVGVVTFLPSSESEAQQVLLTRKCCDGSGAIRCVLENWTPVGNACFCYDQGWGYAC